MINYTIHLQVVKNLLYWQKFSYGSNRLLEGINSLMNLHYTWTKWAVFALGK